MGQLELTAARRSCRPRLDRASDMSKEAGNIALYVRSQLKKNASSNVLLTTYRANLTHKPQFLSSASKRFGHRVPAWLGRLSV